MERIFKSLDGLVDFLENVEINTEWNSNNCNLYEEENYFEYQIAVLGYSKKELEVSVASDKITIKGDKKDSRKRLFSSFYIKPVKTEIKITNDMDIENIKASAENGILTIKIGKKEHSKKRNINID